MRIKSFVKIVVVTLAFVSAAALPWNVPTASAKAMKPMKLPPGACAVEKKAVNTGTICSFQCNAANWCAQQFCNNGTLVQVWPCYGPFCAAKCPG